MAKKGKAAQPKLSWLDNNTNPKRERSAKYKEYAERFVRYTKRQPMYDGLGNIVDECKGDQTVISFGDVDGNFYP